MALTKVSRGLLTTSIVDNGNATAITIGSDESTTFSGPVQLTAGALAAAGNAGLSHRSADNKVYLQAGTGGFNILDDQQNTHFSIDSAGVSSFYNNTGIGTSSPSNLLHLHNTAGDSFIRMSGGGSLGVNYGGFVRGYGVAGTGGYLDIGVIDANSFRTAIQVRQQAAEIIFKNGDTERMRLTGGNLLVGKTSNTFSTPGFVANANGMSATRSGGACVQINRTSSDGSIQEFYKDGSIVGKINTVSTGGGSMIIGNDSSGIMFRGDLTTSAFIPASPASNAQVDNTLDVGHAAIRFDDIYATNPTIQTSDRNEKQDIEELSDAEQRVAVACKGLLRKFRWIDAVEAKGDDARIHFGIIAQDLQAAFEAEGLDAGRYAMFISSTWWETQTEVAAVEATEDTEAVDAYTRTDTYHTAEAAPEGATERTRLGIRSSELLAFIISAI